MAETRQRETAGDTGRNTKVKARCYIFTWNNYPPNHNMFVETLAPAPHRYLYQEETGQTGNKHLQGCIHFKSARSWNSVQKALPGAHVERARNWLASVKYCSKEETRTGGQFSNFRNHIAVDPLAGVELYAWQQAALDLISAPCTDDRKVHWFVDRIGNRGKTALCKHILLTKKDWTFVSAGKGADILYSVAARAQNGRRIEGVLANFTREAEDHISYAALEALKDGLFFAGKYESSHVVMDPPHVLCFSNWMPELSKLSADRWNIINLD